MAKNPEIGTSAPDFTLPSLTLVDGAPVRDTVTLSDHRGTPIVLAFLSGRRHCRLHEAALRVHQRRDQFTDIGATVWAISPQDIDSHEAFAVKHSLGMPLLADVGRTVISEYGVAMFGIEIFTGRCS